LLSQDDLPERLLIKGCITLEDLFGLPGATKKKHARRYFFDVCTT
jgi:hypothetical protein